MSKENQLYDKMLFSDCINDITDTIIKTQIKMTSEYIDNFLSGFDVINNGETYVPKKIIIKNDDDHIISIPKSSLTNNNQLALKDFNVSGKFKLVPSNDNSKFFVDFTNNNGIEIDISINVGKMDNDIEVDDINNIINQISNGKDL